MKIRRISFWSVISCAYDPGYIQTFISFTLFDLSNIMSSKKSTFISCSVLTDSATICVCLSIAFFFSSFDHEIFEKVATVVYDLYVVYLSLKLNQKGLIYYYAYANVANIIVWSFVWRKFSSVGNWEWWDEIKYGKKLKLGDAHVTPRNIQEVQASKLGDAPEAPLLHRQKN
jgi:hypothetical protein